MSEAPNSSARWVRSEEDVDELAELITDPERTQLVIGVTTQPAREKPMVDAERLAILLGDRAQVWVLTEAEHAWALTEELPEKIDVYGGAVRAWNPIPADAPVYPSDHPQWTVFGPEDAIRVLEQVPAYVDLADNPVPHFGSVVKGVVTGVRKAGGEIELETGHPAFASLAHLVQHGEVYHAADVLQEGQKVTVRVGAWHPQAGRVSVSMRDFAPDPWERIDEVYKPGDIIEVGVSGIAPFGAFVEILPGAEGLLHKSKVSDEFVHYIEDYVAVGERLVVRLLSIDVRERQAAVSLRDVPHGAHALDPAPIFPGGPPWLPDPEDPADEEDEFDGPRGEEARSSSSSEPAAAPAPSDDYAAVSYRPQLKALVSELLGKAGRGDDEIVELVRDALERAAVTLDATFDAYDESSDEPSAPVAELRNAAGALIDALRGTEVTDEPAEGDEPEVSSEPEVSDELAPADEPTEPAPSEEPVAAGEAAPADEPAEPAPADEPELFSDLAAEPSADEPGAA